LRGGAHLVEASDIHAVKAAGAAAEPAQMDESVSVEEFWERYHSDLPLEVEFVPKPVGGFKGLGVAADYRELSDSAANLFFHIGERAMRLHGWFHVMLSGGETPVGMYEVLALHAKHTASARIANRHGGYSLHRVPFWSRVKIYWTNDPRSATHRRDTTSVVMRHLIEPLNYYGAKLRPAVNYFPLAGNSRDPVAEAARYETLLRHELAAAGGYPDLILAGAGSDGQIFGIPPNFEAADDRWVTLTTTAKGPWLTITPELFERARDVVLMMVGHRKQIPLINLLMERGSERDMPVRIARRIRARTVLLVDRDALTWPPFRAKREDGYFVSGDYREGMDPRGPIGIGVHGFMGAGSMANLVVGLYLRSLRTNPEIVDGSFVAVHRGAGGAKRLYGYLPLARRWLRPERELLRDFAAGIEAVVKKVVRDEVRKFGSRKRAVYFVGHSDANQIIKYVYAHLKRYPAVREAVRVLVLTNPFSVRIPEVYHAGVRVIDHLLPTVGARLRPALERLRELLTRERSGLRESGFRLLAHGALNLLTNPLAASIIRTQQGRWKAFLSHELILPAMEEAGLPLEFYPSVAEAYKRIAPEAFLRELYSVLKLNPAVEERANQVIRGLVADGRLRVLVIADPDDPIASSEGARAAARAMGAEFVELRMRDHAHRLKSRALEVLGPHMTHMLHPDFIPVVEAFLRRRLEINAVDPALWRVATAPIVGAGGARRPARRADLPRRRRA
jgi:6-phosphogluconolactonase